MKKEIRIIFNCKTFNDVSFVEVDFAKKNPVLPEEKLVSLMLHRSAIML